MRQTLRVSLGGQALRLRISNEYGDRPLQTAGEVLRQQLNAWIRDGGGFDAVVDFDLALRDPTRPDRQRAELNSGDFSHPNAAGYGAMARAVDLQQLRR